MTFAGNANAGFFQRVGFVPSAVKYSGNNSYLSTNAFSGTNSYLGTCSFWMNPQSFDMAANASYLMSLTNKFTINLSTPDWVSWGLVVTCSGTGSSLNYIWNGARTVILPDNLWHHYAISWDMNHAASSKLMQVYIDGVAQVPDSVFDGNAAFQVNLASSGACELEGSGPLNGTYTNAAFSETYINTVAKIDLSVSANLQLFRSATGHPVKLGTDGSTPTGAQPTFYLKNPAISRGTNSGSATNLTANGTFVNVTGP